MKPDRHQLRLVKRAIEGDGEAFLSMCRRYDDVIYRYFYFRSGSADAAEDMTVDLFVRAWEQLPRMPEVFLLPTPVWLLRLANELVEEHTLPEDLARQNLKRPPMIAWSEHAPGKQRPRLNPRHLAQAVTQMDPLAQQVIVLRFMLRLSHETTALIIDDTEDGSRALQYRSLTQLREVLSRKRLSQKAYSSDYVDVASFCVDRIISDTWSVERCLEHVSEPDEQYKETFHFAAMVRHAGQNQPPPSLEKQFAKELQRRLKASKRLPKWQFPRLPLLTSLISRLRIGLRKYSKRLSPVQRISAVVAALVLITGLAVLAAFAYVNSAGPRDLLYPLELRMEERYLALLQSPEARTRFRLKLTEERLREAERQARRGDPGGIKVALVAYSLEVGAIINENEQISTQPPDGGPDLNMIFSEQQQHLDEIFSVMLRNRETNGSTESSWDIACTDAPGTMSGQHPVALTLSTQFGRTYNEVLEWVCHGHSFGGIVLALASEKHTQLEPERLLERKAQLGGWGKLWDEMRLE